MKEQWTFDLDPRGDGLRKSLEVVERTLIYVYLLRTNWNVSHVCRILNTPRQSIYNKMRRYDIMKPVEEEEAKNEPVVDESPELQSTENEN